MSVSQSTAVNDFEKGKSKNESKMTSPACLSVNRPHRDTHHPMSTTRLQTHQDRSISELAV